MENCKISIVIPAYIKDSSQLIFLENAFDSILRQTFINYEIVLTDHSTIYDIEALCEKYSNKIKILYIKNFYGRGVPTENVNIALKHCSGEYIKILHCDDFFVDNRALEKIVNTLDSTKKKWLVNGFNHTYDGISFFNEKIPQYPDHLLIGNNLLGAPSNVTIRNDSKEDFDVNITMGIDIEWYHRLRMKYGMPYILNDILVTSRIRDDRVSAVTSKQYDIVIDGDGSSWQFIQSELEYIKNKHAEFFENWQYPND
jgi:glycosyltransferase involved in cell wall biosynthesis